MKFSQRIGKTPAIKDLQLESIDAELKNGLWDIYNLCILESISTEYCYEWGKTPSIFFSNSLWHNYFKKTIDNIPPHFDTVCSKIRKNFFECEWYQVYDLIEASLEILQDPCFGIPIESVYEAFNRILEREFAGYRFLDGVLSPVTNKYELEEITEALALSNNLTSLKGCNIHLETAIRKLSDRQNPDFRNSIKESISAVESVANVISGNAKDSLGVTLAKIKDTLKIHPALEKGFKQIYGYTSDSDGIRHALTTDATCDFEDAKFMLVSCSAFINYLAAKSNKAGISLG